MYTSEALSTKLDHILYNVDSLQLNLIERVRNRGEIEYISYHPQIQRTLNNELASLTLNTLVKFIQDRDVVNFDPTVYEDETIESIETNSVPNFDKIQTVINSQQQPFSEIEMSKIWAYCLTIECTDGERIILFRKYSHTKTLEHKFQFTISKEGLNKVESDVVTIDNRVDAFYYDGILYILNRYFFEIIFSFTDIYHQVLESALNELQSHNIIEGFDEFKQECLNNNKLAKKFTKIMSENGLQTYLTNINEIPSIISEYYLHVRFVNGKLVYEDKTNLPEIVKLLSNEYVQAALNKEKYEAPMKRLVRT